MQNNFPKVAPASLCDLKTIVDLDTIIFPPDAREDLAVFEDRLNYHRLKAMGSV